MRCPYCQSEDTQVKDSRPAEDGAVIRRRRVCSVCGGRFTTFERVQLRDLMVVKKSGRRVPFDRASAVFVMAGLAGPFQALSASLKVQAKRKSPPTRSGGWPWMR